MANRIDYLDGLRGLAILLVVAYHAYARWSDLVPYGDNYADIPLVRFGWLGVQLFFVISGFVILMSLEKSQGAVVFLFKRWLRLFPAMLIASLLVFFSADLLSERPAGAPPAINLLPGLTFIEPGWLSRLFQMDINSLEGAFWSLYVEVKFYILAAIIYFWRGRNTLIVTLLGAYGLYVVSAIAFKFSDHLAIWFAYKVFGALSFPQFGWFAAGSCYYIFHKTGQTRWFWGGVAISLISSLFVRELHMAPVIPAFIVSAIFAIALRSKLMQAALRLRIFWFFGFVSYPLYLIHENAMIALTIKLGASPLALPGYLYPVGPVIALSALAYLIAKYGEPLIKRIIRQGIAGIARLLSTRRAERTGH